MELKIDKNLDGKTVKEILFNHLNLSKKLVSYLKRGENIFLNDEFVTVRKVVLTGDILKINIMEQRSENIVAEDIPLDILYEDEDILAVNKPYNMPTHTSFRHYNKTLANAVMNYFKNRDFVYRAVNRLDKDTTGIVLIAKNRIAADFLNKQIKEKKIKKIYKAICVGEFENKEGTINIGIKRESQSVIKRIASNNGQYAITSYKVMAYKNGCSLVELIPKTGRTHQLRVHMAYINHPIYADFLYGNEVKQERTRLHCSCMEFQRPKDNSTIKIVAPTPSDFFIL